MENSSEREFSYYFAYGSNLKKKRLHINCKNAKFICIAKLENYSLVFAGASGSWGGAPANVVESTGSCVWGAVWELNQEDVTALDRQEGVHLGIYKRIEVDVVTVDHNDKVLRCISYEKVRTEAGVTEALPSITYLSVIIEGAKEVGLPSDYQKKLETFEHNGKKSQDDKLNSILDHM